MREWQQAVPKNSEHALLFANFYETFQQSNAAMPQLPYSIELHDSELGGIDMDGENVHIFLCPAYIHRDGKGWTQDVRLTIAQGKIEGGDIGFPANLYDGYLETELGIYHNLLEIPFAAVGDVTLELELITGERISIIGTGLSHDFIGEPVFVEECPF